MGKWRALVVAITGVILLVAVPNVLGASGSGGTGKRTVRDEAAGLAYRPSVRSVLIGSGVVSGGGVVNGTMRDFSGAPVTDGWVMWHTPNWSSGGSANTNADGFYQFVGVPALSDAELVFADPNSSAWLMRAGATFADPGPSTFDCWPGRIPVTATRGGPWSKWQDCDIELFGADALSSEWTDQRVSLDLTATKLEAAGDALPGSYTSAVFVFHGGTYPVRHSEALEVDRPEDAPVVVVSNEVSTDGFVADEAAAYRVTIAGWASGSPGSYATLTLANFRAGDVLDISGQSLSGHDPEQTFQTVTIPTPAPAVVRVKLRVPTGIPLGDFYIFQLQRAGGELWLTASFQACSLVATQASIRRGSSVRLSGNVPFETYGDDFATTTVALFKRTKASGQPRRWSATSWTKLMTLKTTNTGRFVSPPLHPSRTTWYVVRYLSSGGHGAGSFWRGFTSVLKVRVH